MVCRALVLLLVGCGRLAFDPRDDGSVGDGATADASMFTGSNDEYLKASNASMGDSLGGRLGISHDGTRIVVSAMLDDNSAGAAYVFVRSGDVWVEEAYLKASNVTMGDQFGRYVAMSGDGNIVAVGANLEDSNGTEADNSVMDSGAVYVFARSGTTWTQQAYIKPTVIGMGDNFGTSVALDGDGDTLIVGAFNEASGIVGNPLDDSEPFAGAAYVFGRTGTTWSERAYLKASNTETLDRFGEDVTLSADGMFAVVGAPLESSIAQGINGNEADNSARESGAAYVYARNGSTWSQQAYVKASNTALSDALGSFEQFGWSVTLSAAGDTLVVGARLEGSAATGVNGNQNDQTAGSAGAAYVFVRDGATWSQQAYIKAPNTGANDFFGETLRLSADGTTLVVTAPLEDGSATGFDGPFDEAAPTSGAVYQYSRTGTQWAFARYIKAPTTDAGDNISGLALSGDATTLAIGAPYEDGGSRGVGGDQADDSLTDSGAVFIYW